MCVQVVIGGWRGEWRSEVCHGGEIEQMRDREQKTKKHKMKTKHWRTEALLKNDHRN